MSGQCIAYHPSLKFIRNWVKEYIIYTLKNPFTNEVFYVGKTSDGLAIRLRGHLSDRENNKPKAAYIRSIVEKGATPIIEAIEVIDGICAIDKHYAGHREIHWIRHYLSIGANLYNISCISQHAKNYQYERYLQDIKDRKLDLSYYLCGKTPDGCEVYDEQKMIKDGFCTEESYENEVIDLVSRAEYYAKFMQELRQDFKNEDWPPSWIKPELIKKVLPMPDWSPEFLADMPEDEFLLDLQLEDDPDEIDDWDKEDDEPEIDDGF